MGDEKKIAENKKPSETPEVKTEEKKEDIQRIEVDAQTAFNLKIQEFDKNIAVAEFEVARVKKERMEFIHNTSLGNVMENYKAKLIQNQVEEEMRKKNQTQSEKKKPEEKK